MGGFSYILMKFISNSSHFDSKSVPNYPISKNHSRFQKKNYEFTVIEKKSKAHVGREKAGEKRERERERNREIRERRERKQRTIKNRERVLKKEKL